MIERDAMEGLRGMLFDDEMTLIRECMLQAGIKANEQKAVSATGWNLCHRVASAAHKAGATQMKAIMSRPIDMVLHCPACGTQHIDEPWKPGEYLTNDQITGGDPVWTNPPHRSHQCQSPKCGHVWRPADVATNGVAAIKTKGTADNVIVAPRRGWSQRVAADYTTPERVVDPSEKHPQTSDTPIHWISVVDAMPAHGQKIAAASENGRWEETFNEDYVDLSMTHWRPA